MYKGIYAEKKTFSKFDNEHYLCYLNEQREEYSPEPDARSCSGLTKAIIRFDWIASTRLAEYLVRITPETNSS